MKICIQAGHVNTTTSATGAPNEMSFNLDIANQVSAQLRERGFEVKQTDANADKDPAVTGIDWDLFLAIHYDADIYGTGGYFVDFPEPSTDFATKESQRIQKILSGEYGKVTGIVNHPERSNANTRYYYIWKALSAKTPCNLIECGVGMHVPDDWQILHFDRPRVVEGIVRGICLAMGVNYTSTTTTVTTTSTSTSSSTTTLKPSECEEKLKQIHDTLYGKGWWWKKWAKIKALVPK